MKEKVVLAYSGGLDTSYCVKYLSEELGLKYIPLWQIPEDLPKPS